MNWSPLLWVCLAAFYCGLTCAVPRTEEYPTALLGEKECLYGPSYWCMNFTTARQCNANQHCIRTVWEHQVLPPDNGEICETCKKMVAQARDELKSNETQENIKLVLEGSCMILIPIKPLAKECVKLVDQAIPELIEAIASQMNPQMVCSVAGLCNSAHMDKLFAMYKLQFNKDKNLKLNCDNCEVLAGMADKNFRTSSRDEVLNSFLELCGTMGSFSDGCAATIIVHFNKLYEKMAANLYPAGICHLAGVCQQKYHNHSKSVEIRPVPKLEGDMPCELCEQLVQHLRDILVANTTEKEFEQVLLGICGQTKGYKKECVDLVETYYPVVYTFLTEELDGKVICTQIGICPKSASDLHPLYPLLPVQLADSLQKDSTGLHRVSLSSPGVSVHSGLHSLQVPNAQLPLDSLVVVVPGDKNLCKMCEYFLHFLQEEMADPKNEQAIMKLAEKACNDLPNQYTPMCRNFVDTYTPAIIALLTQNIDPSQVCPNIGVCPGFLNNREACEPCKQTTLHLVTNIGSNTTEANIKKELMTLCLSLSFEDSRHCFQMLTLHSEDLTDMVIAEFTSDEMCFFMKYCNPSSSLRISSSGDTETNEIHKSPVDASLNKDICVLCEFVLKTLEKDIQDKKTEEQIREAVEHVCFVMPSTIRPQCKKFVDQYSDLIVTLLAQSINPEQICQMIGLCSSSTVTLDYMHNAIGKCVVCESLMGALQGVMEDSELQRDFNRQLEVACLQLPQAMGRECQDIVRQLAPQIEMILQEVPVGTLVCRRLKLCGHSQTVDLIGSDRCDEGQTYWCLSTMHAATCEKIEHCQKNVWLAEKPNKKSNIRAKKFIF